MNSVYIDLCKCDKLIMKHGFTSYWFYGEVIKEDGCNMYILRNGNKKIIVDGNYIYENMEFYQGGNI